MEKLWSEEFTKSKEVNYEEILGEGYYHPVSEGMRLKDTVAQKIDLCVEGATLSLRKDGEVYLNDRLLGTDKEIFEGLRTVLVGGNKIVAE